ncbi:MAG TPA: FkbM family methyltransferase [Pyrinomonadaceae bacterium]|nr:FkbM family methyltransferase [Pyrinomonadaceae bacterium]
MKKVLSLVKSRLRRPSNQDLATYRQLQAKLAGIPRYQPGFVNAGEWQLKYLDATSLLSAFDVVIVKRWNDFPCTRKNPVILDGGANIGISSIHYKQHFPDATIIAFEPDPSACDLLRHNLTANKIHDVEVVEKALWTSNGSIGFFSEGADANRVVAEREEAKRLTALVPGGRQHRVETVRLADYLAKTKFDLVKLDIESAEAEVIVDCGDTLRNVNNLVIEFHLTNSKPNDLARTLTVLAEQKFHVSVCSYGPWVDLLHQTSNPPHGKIEFDQYLLISAWRASTQ